MNKIARIFATALFLMVVFLNGLYYNDIYLFMINQRWVFLLILLSLILGGMCVYLWLNNNRLHRFATCHEEEMQELNDKYYTLAKQVKKKQVKK